MIRPGWLALLAGSLVSIAVGAEPARKLGDPEALAAIMAGEYVVIGRHTESDETYQGRIVLAQNGKGFDVTRTIAGHVVKGTASFETTAGSDHIPVLRMRFVEEGKELEGTYQWKSDLENYFRLTGYIYALKEPTESPGLEALFPAEPLKPRED